MNPFHIKAPSLLQKAIKVLYANGQGGKVDVERTQITKALKQIYLLAVPAALVLWTAAPLVLRLYGPQYAANATTCLRFLAIGTLFSCANYVSDTVLLAFNKVHPLHL